MTITENPIRNGVDTATLFATLDAVRATPEIAKFQFRATNRWVSGTHNQLDAPRLLRRHAGDGPPAALHLRRRPPGRARRRRQRPDARRVPAARLAACLTAGIANIAAARGVNLESVESTVEGDIDLLGILGLSDEVRNGYQQIRVSFTLRGDDPEKLARRRRAVPHSGPPSSTC